MFVCLDYCVEQLCECVSVCVSVCLCVFSFVLCNNVIPDLLCVCVCVYLCKNFSSSGNKCLSKRWLYCPCYIPYSVCY